MKFVRHFTKNLMHPFEYVEWVKEDVEIKNDLTGDIIFRIKGAEVPSTFDKNSREVLTSKYFRMTEVPVDLVHIDEVSDSGKKVPDWLRRREPIAAVKDLRVALKTTRDREDYLRLKCDVNIPEIAGELKIIREKLTALRGEYNKHFTHERSAKQVFSRLAGFWAYWGWMNDYFGTEDDARIFYDETIYMLENQMAAPNTPQWFNSGLYWAYGIEGDKKGLWRYNPKTGKAEETTNFYQYPGIHACHIINCNDSLFDEGGIYDDLMIEAKAFAIGGGVGKNTSNIRSKFEYLRTGSRASGSMEFAVIDDKSAGVIKSGSGQRRAAKMVIKDMDDPEVPEFIVWKEKEEKKVEALVAAGYSSSWEGEAYKTVSGQNSNNSVRMQDSFMRLAKTDEDWPMTSRTTGEIVRKMKAKELWKSIVDACWHSGDPGVQFDSTIQAWDTCPKDGRIRATNPCAEYIFKDNSSCNLASINLQKLFEETGDKLKVADFIYVCSHWLTILDISVDAAQLPSRQLAEGTARYRTTGLGHTGLGAVLERSGIPYDSEEACHLGAAVTSLMTAQCYIQSSRLAKHLSTFAAFKENKTDMLKVIRNHRLASSGNPNKIGYEGKITPWEINHSVINKDLGKAIINAWDEALQLGNKYGYRNAFVTLIQPSGTVGLLMGCDTTSIEPDYRIVKLKRLSGGSSMRMVNRSIHKALENLGYTDSQIEDIETHVAGNNTLDDAPFINRSSLMALGIVEKDIDMIEKDLDPAIQLCDAFDASKWTPKSKEAIGLPSDYKCGVNIFMQMNFTKEQYLEATKWICGYGTLEGAPYLKPEHLPIFDCAVRSGYGKRYLRWEAHVKMVIAVSPHISGGISKTLNMPNDATREDIESAILMAYEGGAKCIALYRDGSKKSQPLVNPYDINWWDPLPPDMILPRGARRRAPTRRNMLAHEVTIYDPAKWQKVVFKFGEYEDGSLAEIWIEVTKDIPSFHFAMKWASRAISNAIQYGAPLSDICKSYGNEEGGPCGRTDHPYITYCKSVIDLAIKLAMLEYEGDITFCHRKPPLHEVRCGKLKTKKQNAEVKLEEKSSDLLRPIDNRCPKCGSSDIEKYPCPVCVRCGTPLGGCSA